MENMPSINRRERFRQSFMLWAAVATFVGLAVPFVSLALQANKSKRLDVTYLAKLSLVNPVATPPTSRGQLRWKGHS